MDAFGHILTAAPAPNLCQCVHGDQSRPVLRVIFREMLGDPVRQMSHRMRRCSPEGSSGPAGFNSTKYHTWSLALAQFTHTAITGGVMKAIDIKVGMKVMIVQDTVDHGDKLGT